MNKSDASPKARCNFQVSGKLRWTSYWYKHLSCAASDVCCSMEQTKPEPTSTYSYDRSHSQSLYIPKTLDTLTFQILSPDLSTLGQRCHQSSTFQTTTLSAPLSVSSSIITHSRASSNTTAPSITLCRRTCCCSYPSLWSSRNPTSNSDHN